MQFQSFTSVFEKKEDNLQNFFDYLKLLNKYLGEVLPINLFNLCNIGSIDQERNFLVIFINDQHASSLIRQYGNEILSYFSQKNLYFDGIIYKMHYNKEITIKKKNNQLQIDELKSEAMKKLALAINMPEIISSSPSYNREEEIII